MGGKLRSAELTSHSARGDLRQGWQRQGLDALQLHDDDEGLLSAVRFNPSLGQVLCHVLCNVRRIHGGTCAVNPTRLRKGCHKKLRASYVNLEISLSL